MYIFCKKIEILLWPVHRRTRSEEGLILCVSSPQMYLVIFPEGTRYNPELKNVIDASQAFAVKEGTGMIAAIYYCTAAY